MPAAPSISIIVPVYNAAKWLGRCIDSIRAQNHTDWELLLVDDGSTDGSAGICDSYADADPRIRAIHQANGGASCARNTGITNATGRYICFIDSDDWIAPEYLKDLIDNQLAPPDLVISSFRLTRGKHTEILEHKPRRFEGASDIAELFNIFDYHRLTGTPFCKLFCRDIIEIHKLRFHEGIHLGEDTMFVLEYLLHCDSVAFTGNAYYNYAIHSGSLSSRPCSLESAWLEHQTSERIAAAICKRFKLAVNHPYLTFQSKVHYGRLLDAIEREPRRTTRMKSLLRLDIANMRLVNTPYTAYQRIAFGVLYHKYFRLYDALTQLRRLLK